MTDPTIESEAPPLVVAPIPPEASRTLRLTRRLTWLAPIVGFLPDIIAFFATLWATDPNFAVDVTNFIPVQYRAITVAIIVAIAQKYGQLRRDTAHPISGTSGEARALSETEEKTGGRL